MQITINTFFATLGYALLLTTLVACSAKGDAQGQVRTAVKSVEGWFCQTDESGEEWECVQDNDLARSPVPTRLPEAAKQTATDSAIPRDSSIDPIIKEDFTDLTSQRGGIETIDEQTGLPTNPAASPSEPQLAKFQQLAYQSATPTPILELPENLYAVQLLAMANADQLDSFIEKNSLQGMMPVRLARGANLYHVLILGVYKTEEIAREASSDLPTALAGIRPWIRELGSLQTAIIRADKLVNETKNEIAEDTSG